MVGLIIGESHPPEPLTATSKAANCLELSPLQPIKPLAPWMALASFGTLAPAASRAAFEVRRGLGRGFLRSKVLWALGSRAREAKAGHLPWTLEGSVPSPGVEGGGSWSRGLFQTFKPGRLVEGDLVCYHSNGRSHPGRWWSLWYQGSSRKSHKVVIHLTDEILYRLPI